MIHPVSNPPCYCWAAAARGRLITNGVNFLFFISLLEFVYVPIVCYTGF